MTEDIFHHQEEPAAGPGKLLQSAREEKNLRPEDVAYEIRLTPAQVLALEENDYSKMPEETYVRGYLRNYARLVGIPENDILMAFARHTRSSEVKPQPVAPVSEGDINKGSNGFRLLAAVIFLSIILLSAVWVFEPYDKEAPVVADVAPAVTESEQTTTTVPVGPSTLKLDEVDDKAELKEAIIAPASVPETPEDDGNVVAEGTGEVASTLETDPAQESQQAGGQVAVPDTQPATEETTGSTADAGTLLIDYSKDSWTDIRDANGKKLIYRTVKAGENIALSGPLPLSLFFGFAQGVKVTFNGEEIDVESHTRGVFARFTVGEAVSQ